MIIRDQLYDLGIVPGDVVLMHSSMKSLKTDITPEKFLLELTDALTPEGTLLLPALTYESVTFDNPRFSINDSEPCVGILTKTFHKMPGVIRSMHPTHSVCAWGVKADELTKKHKGDNTPVGPGSPFMLLPDYKGKLLFVGDVLGSCTFMHGIEEIVNAPYTLNEEITTYTLTDSTGNTRQKDYYTHNFKGWDQEYERIREVMSYPDIKTGLICSATCTLIDAGKLKSAATERLKQDIYAFVSKSD